MLIQTYPVPTSLTDYYKENHMLTKSAYLPNPLGNATYHAFVGLEVKYAGDEADQCYAIYECTETGSRRVWGSFDANLIRWHNYVIVNN